MLWGLERTGGDQVRTIIRGGVIVSLDSAIGALPRGDVLIEDGVIVSIASEIEASDAEVIDATRRIVMPGFVDNHRHAWQTAFRGMGADWTFPEWALALHRILKPHYEPEDVYIATLMGRLEALHSGVTTMLDWFHCALTPEHTDAAIAGLREAPGRSIFCYGAGWGTAESVESEIRRVRGELADDLARVSMAWGLRGIGDTSVTTTSAELALASELNLRTSLHIASDGTQRPVAELERHGLLRSTTTYVHVTGVQDDELRMIAAAGGSVSVSPDVELKMGFGLPMTGRMLAAGLRPTLSIDDVPSVGGDMFSPMRTAFAAQRGIDGTLTSRDVLDFATIDAARSLGIEDRAGSLAPGKSADIILLRIDDPTVFPVTDPVGAIVTAGHPGLVDTVMVGGLVVKRNGVLTGVDLPVLMGRLLASRDRVAASACVPTDGSWRPQPTVA
jgi:5-methylthioadenosine/S-adenosylhomocysteine deaminase